MTTENSADKTKKPIWSPFEMRTLQFLGLLLLVVGIFYLMTKEPTAGATSLVGGILLLLLSKPEIISSIEGLGFKLSIAKAEIENTIKIAEQQLTQLRKSAIDFTRQELEKQANMKRPISLEEKKKQRKIYNEFQERFRELGCAEEEIQQHSSFWREAVVRQWESEQNYKNSDALVAASSQLWDALMRVKMHISGELVLEIPLPEGMTNEFMLEYEKLSWTAMKAKQNGSWGQLLELFESVQAGFDKFKDYPPVEKLLGYIEVNSEIGKRPVPPLELPESWPTP